MQNKIFIYLFTSLISGIKNCEGYGHQIFCAYYKDIWAFLLMGFDLQCVYNAKLDLLLCVHHVSWTESFSFCLTIQSRHMKISYPETSYNLFFSFWLLLLDFSPSSQTLLLLIFSWSLQNQNLKKPVYIYGTNNSVIGNYRIS